MSISSDRPNTDANGNGSDNLTQIEGIGPVRQKWVRERFNVRTFHDLARLSPDQIESSLRDDRKPVSFHDIESWIRQAKALAQSSASSASMDSQTPLAETFGLNNGVSASSSAQSSGDSTGRASVQNESAEWKTIASFDVEFQTRLIEGDRPEYRTWVRCLQTGRVRIWSGFVSEKVPQWIAAQLDEHALKVSSLEDESDQAPQESFSTSTTSSISPAGVSADRVCSDDIESSAQTPSCEGLSLSDDSSSTGHQALSPISVAITRIRAFQHTDALQPVVSITPNHEAPLQIASSMQAQEPFQIELDVTLPGITDAHFQGKGVTGHMHMYAYNRATGSIEAVGGPYTTPIEDIKPHYTITFPKAVLPQGLYRIKVLFNLQGASSVPGYAEIPLLQFI
ncbi:MAG: hypothetical protein ACFE0J_13295 [Elainellaceae cyanobacterium]